ncbi:MAG: coproporphyrinogen III oxidase family protein [Kiritimatiellae bacterium]|nr:coproporphyrinogen III oxidase family protein [Kiritimatiellia bacterium]
MHCANLYVHFPFCRQKCSYCALYSRPRADERFIRTYSADIASAVAELGLEENSLKTIYFGGGTPALCNLKQVFSALEPFRIKSSGEDSGTEFTIELHPLDVTDELLSDLKNGGVNRISLGVQSLDDSVLRHMGRGYDSERARKAFVLVKKYSENAGIDLIVGYPGEKASIAELYGQLASWGLKHCSVYALQNERNLSGVPEDAFVMDRIALMAEFLSGIGLQRYEISNYAVPGYECKHNLAVWRGEDYIGLGEGACGRLGLRRTRNWWGTFKRKSAVAAFEEVVEKEFDDKERRLFRLRTREGLDASSHPQWLKTLESFAADGLLEYRNSSWVLTPRGMEVCDTILQELV